jgi:hypothetical protein
MRAAQRSGAVVPHAPQLSFKTHQDHVKNIIDMLLDIIAQYPDDTIALSPELAPQSRFGWNVGAAEGARWICRGGVKVMSNPTGGTVALSRSGPHPALRATFSHASRGRRGKDGEVRLYPSAYGRKPG